MTTRTFLITGAGSGLGRAFAQGALAAGHTVVGTVRKSEDLEKFEALAPGRAHARQLDVTDDEAVFAVVGEVERSVGPIDVLIANAGYGHEGVFEESSMAQLRAQFDANVFGVAATVHAVLPGMRKRRSGHIFGVSSMGGLMTVPGLAYYCGSKYAVEGMLETLSKEVADLGVRVTIIAPGSFRTDWAGRSMVRSARSISDYDGLFEPIRAARQAASGNQLGDPAKAAEAVLTVLDAEKPPVHLVLGSDAVRLVANGRAAVAADLEEWEKLSRSTDFPDGHQIAAN
ncbi:oxidoreductase [Amycolatopsis jiangsuensis]|uniref:NAD(P)-dependent dehydrogenase (Short-subunit alcohol dehydrogenase family) n=1 Tax=Amycolatopsis jiangsuensis TaxID=1181879 RepID=A0A840INC0_9PSEU|nr:oxidoreductase [Amycolatopsis jiangsuensis]MBB4683856.1 NAD(P)-dependent dehydrogenase (short-subunit alcohol dehydrogenase family) [Amycolatopsis jiangsuensis]